MRYGCVRGGIVAIWREAGRGKKGGCRPGFMENRGGREKKVNILVKILSVKKIVVSLQII